MELLDRLPARDGDDDNTDYNVDGDELDAHDRAVKKELDDLKKVKKKQEEKEQESAAKKAKVILQENIEKVSSELEKEGFPGFDSFGLGIVKQKMFEKLQEVGAEKISEYDNPEGWKKVYKEEIWPDLSKRFNITPVDVEKKNADKKEKKKQARIPNKPNNPIPKEDEKKEPTQEEAFADYMKRRKAQLFD
jgi:hypothetical protein